VQVVAIKTLDEEMEAKKEAEENAEAKA